MKHATLIILFCIQSYAQTRTNLFIKKESEPKKIKTEMTSKKSVHKSYQSSNLPTEYLIRKSYVTIDESPVILPTNKSVIKYQNLKSGDLIKATILESVFAFIDSKSPVRAVITDGQLKGSVLIGEANLERNSKRILIDFKKFRDPNEKEIYQIQANAMDQAGVLGLEGEFHSDEGTYFLAEVLAAGATGYADSTISRDQNAFGNSVESKSADTFAKKALVSALSKTSERFAEKIKQSPEYSVLTGPVEIKILVLDQPKLLND